MPLKVFFCRHEGQLPRIGSQLISQADVIVIENAANDALDTSESTFNMVSQGYVTEAEGLVQLHGDNPDEFTRSILRTICDTNKLVKLEKSPFSCLELMPVYTRPRLDNRLSEAVHQIGNWIGQNVEIHKIRDKQLARQLQKLVGTYSANDILCIMGSGHQRPLESYLKDLCVPYRTYRSGNPTLFEESVSRSQLGQALVRADYLRVIAELHFLGKNAGITERFLARTRKRILAMSKASLDTFVRSVLPM